MIITFSTHTHTGIFTMYLYLFCLFCQACPPSNSN